MSKRYAFWRGPDAKPYQGNDGKYAPTEMLAKLGRETSVAATGLSWKGMIFDQMAAGLKMAFAVVGPNSEELNPIDSWMIARAALIAEMHRLGGHQPIDSAMVLKGADAEAAKYFRRPESRYVMVSSLSVNPFPRKSISIGDCRIEALSSRARYPLPDRFKTFGPQSIIRLHAEKTKYIWVAVHTKGRSYHDAVSRATAALDLLRALWTFLATYGRWTMSFGSGDTKPLAAVHTGPFHTLHRPDASLVDKDLYWREDHPSSDRDLFRPSAGWPALEKARLGVQRRIAHLPYRTDLEQIIGRYITALDQTLPDVAFLQMWTLLERITDTVGARYDETIRRTTWFLKDRKLGSDLLDCVRIQRNRYVHSAQEAGQGDQSAFLIKSFLEPHLMTLISNPYSVGSLREYAEVLNLPVDVKRLAELKRWVATALKVHSPHPLKP